MWHCIIKNHISLYIPNVIHEMSYYCHVSYLLYHISYHFLSHIWSCSLIDLCRAFSSTNRRTGKMIPNFDLDPVLPFAPVIHQTWEVCISWIVMYLFRHKITTPIFSHTCVSPFAWICLVICLRCLPCKSSPLNHPLVGICLVQCFPIIFTANQILSLYLSSLSGGLLT